MAGPGTVTLIAKLGQQNDGAFMLCDASDIDYGQGATVTIATDAFTQPEGSWSFPVDTQAAAATDDLSTITRATKGPQFITIYPASDARTVVVKHGVGNILCGGNVDITLDDAHDVCFLIYNTTTSKWMATAGSVDLATQAELDAHSNAADPHPGYLTPVEGDAAYINEGQAAGGVLAGTYPSPSFASDMATQAEQDSLGSELRSRMWMGF